MSNLLALPVVSEKAMAQVEGTNTYLFKVPKSASKIEVAKAVADQYKVKVIGVNTVISKGKTKQQLIHRGRAKVEGQRSDLKKAYVKLAAGESIQLFEGGK
jgi:large subunit ribosomal protein L23